MGITATDIEIEEETGATVLGAEGREW